MKTPLLPLVLSLAAFSLSAFAAGPAVCNPYTFIGRITDASHLAFDANRVATLSVAAADGTLLARSKTFFREDSRNNYFLSVPVSSSPAANCALQGDTVSVSVVDTMGKTWSGVINPATIGAPGTVSEVDIVLAEDGDGDGIDDALFAELEAGWEDSPAYDPSTAYHPASCDSDGDGVSDLDEALSGTNPFSGDDLLAISAFDPALQTVSFKPVGGHSYVIEQSSDMLDWSSTGFSTDDADTSPTRSVLPVPASADSTPRTLYLFPTSSPAFFRISVQ